MSFHFQNKNICGLKLLAVVALVIVAIAPVLHAVNPAERENKRKADYIFMEAQRKNALGDRDAYYMLLKRAAQLNPSETSVVADAGFYDVVMFADTDSAMLTEGLAKMKRHFDTEPSDYYSSLSYGSVVNRLGQIDEAIRVWTTVDSIFPDKPDIAANLADVLTQSRDTANIVKAIEIYNRLERSMGLNLPLSARKIGSMMAIGDSVGAMNEIHRLVDSSPGDVEALLAAGDLNMAFQRPDSALVLYNLACETDSTSGPAYYKRASAYQVMGDSVSYDREIQSALKKDNLELGVKLELLRIYLTEVYADTLRRAQVEDIFSSLTDAHPHEVDVHKLFASYLVAIKDFARAAEQQSYALDIDPSKEDDWRGLISLYISARDVDGQIDAANRALRYFPESHELIWYLSMSQLNGKLSKPAIENSLKALSLAQKNDSTNFELLSNIACTVGDAYYQAEMPDSGFIYYEKSIDYDPDNLLALNNCAYYLACQNRDLDKAEEMISRVIANEPDNPTSLDTYAWVLFKKHDYKVARDFIDKAIELEDDPSAELYHHAGDIYYMVGEPAKAVEYWEKANKLEPGNKLLEKKIKNRAYYYEE